MEQISTIQTKNYIADIIRNEIITGNMKDGDEVTQEQLAEKLGVSRMPVREALQLLEQQGFVTRLPNRHIKINGISKYIFINNLRMLSAVEKEIASIIIEENKSAESLKEALNEYKSQAAFGKETYKYDLNFHAQLSKCLDDEYIANMHFNMLNGFYAYAVRRFAIDFNISAEKAENIISSILEKNKGKMQKNIDEYYNFIIDKMNEVYNEQS